MCQLLKGLVINLKVRHGGAEQRSDTRQHWCRAGIVKTEAWAVVSDLDVD